MSLPAVRSPASAALPVATGPTLSASFVVERFRAFYAQMIDAKTELGLERVEHTEDAIYNAAIDQMADTLSRRLQTLLERDALEAARQGGSYGATLFRQAQYAMAGLADEILIHTLDWPGRSAWHNHLLEMALFQTQDAGERFFDNIDSMLRDRDPITIDLAVIYLLALKLGFQGKYRGEGRQDQLDACRAKLFAFVTNRDPQLLRHDIPVFPDAYAHTINDKPVYRTSPVRLWQLATVGVVVAFLIGSHLVWSSLTSPLFETILSIAEP